MKNAFFASLFFLTIQSTGFAQITNTSGDNLWLYTLNVNNEAKLVGITQGYVDELAKPVNRAGFVVPADVDVYPLTTIGSSAFESVRSLFFTSIVISAATSVEDRAFEKVLVDNIDFGGETLSIGDYAFDHCKVENIIVVAANAVTRIGHYAFFFADRFRGFTTLDGEYLGPIPPGATSIGYQAFRYVWGLPQEVALPSSVTQIGTWFVETGVKRLIIPDTVTHVQSNAFNDPLGDTPNVLLFKGSPPAEPFVFSGSIYRLPGASGWSNTFGGVPVQILLPSVAAASVSPTSGVQFSWTGTGPWAINVERATSPDGPWSVVSTAITNSQFADPAPSGENAFYRPVFP